MTFVLIYRKNVLKLQVFYEDLDVEVISEQRSYEVSSVLFVCCVLEKDTLLSGDLRSASECTDMDGYPEA